MHKTFTDRFIDGIREKRSILICGLDPQFRFMPPHLKEWAKNAYGQTWEAIGQLFFEFNKQNIDAVEPHVPAVKPQMAFYEAYGQWGLWAFEETVRYARGKRLLVIEDAKRGDGGDTADAYANGHLGEVDFWYGNPGTRSPIRVDCMTVHGYIADDCVTRFIQVVKKHGTGIFVVDKTSFRPNSRIEQLVTTSGLTVWQELACMVDKWGEGTEGNYGYRNVGVVMGATYPDDAVWMRNTLPKAWFLVPGYGGQGGTADEAVIAVNSDGFGCGVNSSRGIIYAYLQDAYKNMGSEKFAEAAGLAAQCARDELNEALERKLGKLPW